MNDLILSRSDGCKWCSSENGLEKKWNMRGIMTSRGQGSAIEPVSEMSGRQVRCSGASVRHEMVFISR